MAVDEVLRTKVGIQGIDKALNGGIPQCNTVLISGGAGTGKSTFCMQFLINGATLFGERGLYISTEQNREELYKQAACFNWNIADLEQKNLLKIIYFDITGADGFTDRLNKAIQEFKPKRMVIDSLTTLIDALLVSGMGEDKAFSLVQIAETVNPIPRTDQIITKNILYTLFKEIKKFCITTLLTTELPEDQKTLSADGVSEFISDGVILFRAINVGGTFNRSLEIRKMRYTPMDSSIKSYELLAEGFVLD